MGLACCDNCWERPCVCGHEAREVEKFRKDYYSSIGREVPDFWKSTPTTPVYPPDKDA